MRHNEMNDRHGYGKCHQHIDGECAQQLHEDLSVVASEHLAHGDFLIALLNEIQAHGNQTLQRDDDGNKGKQHDNL